MRNNAQKDGEKVGKMDWEKLAKPINTGVSPIFPTVPQLKNRLNPNGYGHFPDFPNFPTLNRCYAHTECDKEAFEERAAIMEFDGGLPRKEAERLAYEIVYGKHKRA